MRRVVKTASDAKWRLFWCVVMVIMTTIPYLAGALSTNETWRFAGFIVAAEDGYSYLAKMRQGFDGQWLWQLTYTHEPHHGGPFFVFYLLLGKVCRVSGLSLATGYQIARLAGGLFLGWAIDRAARVFAKGSVKQKLTFWIALFGGGLGWLWAILGGQAKLGMMPTDLWVPDGYAWYATLIAPHYALSQAFLILALSDGVRFLETERASSRWLTALWTLCCVLIHPYNVLTIGLLLGLRLLWKQWGDWQGLLHKGVQLITVALPSLPYLVWIAWLFLRTPVFAQWAQTVQNPSPTPLYYLVGYGPFFLLAVPALVRRRWTFTLVQMVVWVLVIGLLLYAPISSQRRFLSGFEFPLSVLAAEGALVAYRTLRLPRKWRRWLVRGVLVLLVMTMLFIVTGTTAAMLSRPSTVFLHKDERSMYQWMDMQTASNDVILASDEVSSHLPVYASARVVWGTLEPETLDAERKGEVVRQFYAAMSELDRRTVLCDWNITYVVWGPLEKAMGAFYPTTASYLRQVDVWGEWTLWAVEDGLCNE